MTAPISITITVKVPAPAEGDLESIDRLAEEVREDVERGVPYAIDVELDDWTT